MQSYFTRGIFFNILGIFFVFLAIQDVNNNEFGFFTYLLILLATMDIGTGIRLMFTHFKLKNKQK
ncbi:YdiK family protein [Domibacillus sp. A3M-37]|uniref:YdiK family protein n=1 Tax=Domibacillus TaxID=1433999 RepID=UPI000617DD17|nr:MULTISPECIES: YdiK family protein [Domibacillus]MCP3762394.1 YdiK family protein [Domibacillus sp. A3M-37]